MFDPVGLSGLANVTAGLLLRGAGSYSSDRIRGELEDAHATIDVHTDWDATWIEAIAPSDKLPIVFDVISLMVTAPRFAPEDVTAVKKAALDHVAAELKSPDTLADRAFAKALYGNHTYGRSIWGDPTSIAAITPGTVEAFYDKFYAANTAVLAVAGPTSADAVTELARTRFGRWLKKKVVPATFLPPATQAATRVFVLDRPGEQKAVVRAGFWTDGRASANSPIMTRLAQRVCEDFRGRFASSNLTADASAAYDMRALQSPFYASFTVPAGRIADSIALVTDALSKAQTGLLTPAQGTCRTSDSEAVSDELHAAWLVAETDFYGAQNLASTPWALNLDDAQLVEAAKTELRPSSLTVVVVGDAKEIQGALKDRYKVEVLPPT
jgi:predicted Zn-dependent peptidase